MSRVAHQDSGKRDQTDQRVDAERLLEQQQSRRDADEARSSASSSMRTKPAFGISPRAPAIELPSAQRSRALRGIEAGP